MIPELEEGQTCGYPGVGTTVTPGPRPPARQPRARCAAWVPPLRWAVRLQRRVCEEVAPECWELESLQVAGTLAADLPSQPEFHQEAPVPGRGRDETERGWWEGL